MRLISLLRATYHTQTVSTRNRSLSVTAVTSAIRIAPNHKMQLTPPTNGDAAAWFTSRFAPRKPDKAVYHFVYHESRQRPLEGDKWHFEQKRNPLI